MFFKKGYLVKFDCEWLRHHVDNNNIYHGAIFSVIHSDFDTVITVRAANDEAKQVCECLGQINYTLKIYGDEVRLLNGMERTINKIQK